MRHLKRSNKLNRDTSHRRCLMANMLKALIVNGRIETTVAKAKVLRMYAEKMITLAKKDTLATRRRAKAKLMVRHNSLNAKESRAAREGNTKAYNDDRKVLKELFTTLKERFLERDGGYTRIIRTGKNRAGDAAPTCIIEYINN